MTRNVFCCAENGNKVQKNSSQPCIENIAMGFITDTNSRSILAVLFYLILEHVWYSILPNVCKYIKETSVDCNQRHSHIIIILCDLKFLEYKNNKLLFIKNIWDNVNNECHVVGGVHVTSSREDSGIQMWYVSLRPMIIGWSASTPVWMGCMYIVYRLIIV